MVYHDTELWNYKCALEFLSEIFVHGYQVFPIISKIPKNN